MAEKHLTVPPGTVQTPLFQEETLERGGAAVARMILGSSKVNLTPLPSQADLYAYAHSKNDPTEPAGQWYIDPQGMHATLQDKKPPTFTNFFVLHEFLNSEQAIANGNLVSTIEFFEVPPAVLVAGGAQWVAVVGYRTDNAGNLQSVFLNDPRPPLSQGTGDPANFEVSASTWSSNAFYFRPVNGGVRWNGKFVTVVDPKAEEPELHAAFERPLADGNLIIPPDKALDMALHLLEERGSLNVETFARAIRGGKPATPQLVQNLDGKDQFYYIMRWQLDEEDGAVVAIDARFGIFLEAIAFSKPIRTIRVTPEDIPDLLKRGIPQEESVETVRERIIDQLVRGARGEMIGQSGWELEPIRRLLNVELTRLRQPIDFITVRQEEINVHPLMVWKSTPESYSLLFPYYQVDTATNKYFIRAIDAQIYTKFEPFFFPRLGG